MEGAALTGEEEEARNGAWLTFFRFRLLLRSHRALHEVFRRGAQVLQRLEPMLQLAMQSLKKEVERKRVFSSG